MTTVIWLAGITLGLYLVHARFVRHVYETVVDDLLWALDGVFFEPASGRPRFRR